MKKKIFTIAMALLASLTFMSCSDVDPSTGEMLDNPGNTEGSGDAEPLILANTSWEGVDLENGIEKLELSIDIEKKAVLHMVYATGLETYRTLQPAADEFVNNRSAVIAPFIILTYQFVAMYHATPFGTVASYPVAACEQMQILQDAASTRANPSAKPLLVLDGVQIALVQRAHEVIAIPTVTETIRFLTITPSSIATPLTGKSFAGSATLGLSSGTAAVSFDKELRKGVLRVDCGRSTTTYVEFNYTITPEGSVTATATRTANVLLDHPYVQTVNSRMKFQYDADNNKLVVNYHGTEITMDAAEYQEIIFPDAEVINK